MVEFQRAQSLISTDRNASIDILHSIGGCSLALLSERYSSDLSAELFLSLCRAARLAC